MHHRGGTEQRLFEHPNWQCACSCAIQNNAHLLLLAAPLPLPLALPMLPASVLILLPPLVSLAPALPADSLPLLLLPAAPTVFAVACPPPLPVRAAVDVAAPGRRAPSGCAGGDGGSVIAAAAAAGGGNCAALLPSSWLIGAGARELGADAGNGGGDGDVGGGVDGGVGGSGCDRTGGGGDGGDRRLEEDKL